jgi:hypothetical protein
MPDFWAFRVSESFGARQSAVRKPGRDLGQPGTGASLTAGDPVPVTPGLVAWGPLTSAIPRSDSWFAAMKKVSVALRVATRALVGVPGVRLASVGVFPEDGALRTSKSIRLPRLCDMNEMRAPLSNRESALVSSRQSEGLREIALLCSAVVTGLPAASRRGHSLLQGPAGWTQVGGDIAQPFIHDVCLEFAGQASRRPSGETRLQAGEVMRKEGPLETPEVVVPKIAVDHHPALPVRMEEPVDPILAEVIVEAGRPIGGAALTGQSFPLELVDLGGRSIVPDRLLWGRLQGVACLL